MSKAQQLIKEVGKVHSVFMGIEDHGIMTLVLEFDFGGTRQSMGNLLLTPESCGALCYDLLLFFGVSTPMEMVGKTLYVLRANPNGLIEGLELFPFEEKGGKQFLLAEWLEHRRGKGGTYGN